MSSEVFEPQAAFSNRSICYQNMPKSGSLVISILTVCKVKYFLLSYYFNMQILTNNCKKGKLTPIIPCSSLISSLSVSPYIFRMCGILKHYYYYFECWRLYWWHYKSNSCNKNWILVFWSEWLSHISRFQFRNRLEMTKTELWSVNSEQCPLSNSDSSQYVRNYWLQFDFQ